MKNITLKVDDATYQRARVRAAEAGTSVSAMVRDFLNAGDRDARRLEALKSLYADAEKRGRRRRGVVPLKRDEVYR